MLRRLLLCIALSLGAAQADAQSYPSPTFDNVTVQGTLAGGNVILPSVFQYFSSAQITDVQTAACTLDLASTINSALTSSGGQLYFPPGTYCIAAPIVLNTNYRIEGAGEYATTIKGKSSGAATVLLQSANYSTLLNGNTAAGPYNFSIRNMGFNGNSAGVTGQANNIQFYAYDFIIENVISYGARCTASCTSGGTGDGIFSQWSTSSGVPVSAGGNGMEAHVYNFKTFSNGGIGIFWEGPHDTVFTDVTTFVNGGAGFSCFSSATALCTINAAGLHSYGNASTGISVAGSGSNLYGSTIEADSNLALDGIFVGSGATVNLTNVWAINNTGVGVALTGANSVITGLLVQGSIGGDGLDFDQSTSTNNLVTSLRAIGNGAWGVDCTNSAATNYVIGARSTGNTSGQYATCSGNTLSGNF